MIERTTQRQCHQKFIRYLNAVKAELPQAKAAESSSTTTILKQLKVGAGRNRHLRWTFESASKSCSWLDAVEGFLAELAGAGITADPVCFMAAGAVRGHLRG